MRKLTCQHHAEKIDMDLRRKYLFHLRRGQVFLARPLAGPGAERSSFFSSGPRTADLALAGRHAGLKDHEEAD